MAKRRRVRTDGAPRLRRPVINGRRSAVWYVVYSKNGKTHRVSTGETVEPKARDFLTRWSAHLSQPRDATTVSECLDHYLRVKNETGAKTVKKTVSALRLIRQEFGALAPSAVTAALQRKYIAQRRSGVVGGQPVSDRTASLELAFLRAALKLADDEGMIAAAPKIKLPKNAGVRRRKRFLTIPEYKRLGRAARDDATPFHMRLFVALALLTAQRGIAIRELKWEHVDFEAGVIWFSQTDPDPASNKNRQDIPITPALEHLLRAAHAVARTEWVIEFRDRPVLSVKRGFRSLITRAGIANVTVHDLRRTVATHLLHQGADVQGVALLLGDDPAIVRAHYAHVSPRLLAAMVNQAGQALDDDETD